MHTLERGYAGAGRVTSVETKPLSGTPDGHLDALRQQTALAKFGEFALRSDNLEAILTEACRLVGDALGTDLAKVMELQSDGETLLVRAGVGWAPDVVGKVTLKAAENSSEGHALRIGEPMISADIDKETRFTYAPFLIENGVEAVANVVIIGGQNSAPFGVLQIDSRQPRQFTEDDTIFLRGYANVLAAAVDRLRIDADRARITEKMAEGEERLRLALEGGDLGSWEIDLDTGAASHTLRYDQIFGYAEPPAVWSCDIFLEHFLPEDREHVAGTFRQSMAAGTEWHFEGRIKRVDDGVVRWIEGRGRTAAVRRTSSGGAPPDEAPGHHLLGVVSDITARKQAESALHHSREVLEARLEAQRAQQENDARFRFATQAGRLGVWELDLVTGDLIASAVCKDSFGHDSTAPFTYKEMLLAIHPDDRVRVQSTIAHSIASGTEYDTECRVMRAKGAIGWVQMHAQVMRGAEGKAFRLAGISLNTTERVLTADRIRHGQRVEAVGRLTAGVAHDFNNVLQALLGALELAIYEVRDQPEVCADLEMALEAGQRGARLTSHLLSFSRQQTLLPLPLELNSLLKILSSTLSRTLGHEIAVQLEVAANLPLILADAAHLDSALLNVALNARDAMPRGGKLKIEAYATDGQVVVAVSDTGEGMTPEVLAQACEPFFTTKGPKGSGLGLSMVEGFVRQSGGELRISSVPGKGSRIELWFPVAAHQAAPTPILKTPLISQGRGKLLLVEDEVAVGLITSTFLRKFGFEVTTVNNSNEALATLADDRTFDAIITDYAMPGTNGVGLVWQARKLIPSLPALMVTGYAKTERMEHLPADVAILCKPFQLDELVRRIQILVRGTTLSPAP